MDLHKSARGLALLVMGAGVTLSCALIVSTSDLTGGSLSPDANATDSGATKDSATADARPNLDGGDGGCPSGRGPAMIVISDTTSPYCIDATEVTNAQYRPFLQANVPLTGQPSPTCDSNSSYYPQDSAGKTNLWPLPASADALPVTNVDWCDAHAFCAWAGKRLCGEIGGGTSDEANHGDANHSQWYHACSMNGTLIFPYGSSYAPRACNGRDFNDAGGTLAVGTISTCVGGYTGISDMAGNAEEWTDSCDDAGCLSRGGSYLDFGPSTVEMCGDNSQNDSPTGRSGDIGFRCCAF